MSTLNNGNSQPNDPADPIYCGFVAGQHVVCINATWRNREFMYPIETPKLHTVYTVRSVELVMTSKGQKVGLLLAEIVNPEHYYGTVYGVRKTEKKFAAWRFRPLKKLRTEDFRSGDAPIDHRVLELHP